ncbi:MAG: zinc-binding dehydrogenase [Bacteroidia bacterium]|nr:zinc-binding dehydrogenase [Bacteroidia bacterium]
MRAAVLVRHGDARTAFELREVPDPVPAPHEVLIRVEAFGLNFADVMARLGLYRDAPPLPAVLGYDVAGTVAQAGSEAQGLFQPGDRVAALTRFGGYAEYAAADARAVVKIPPELDAGAATALMTQYGTAYFMTDQITRLFPGDQVLIHAAAGGVGTALVQLALHRGCTVYGTAGSEEKLAYLRQQGVQHPINYRSRDFVEAVQAIGGSRPLDAVFDPVGGPSVKRGMQLLRPGGRMLVYGASSLTDARGLFQKLRVALGFGFYSPIGLVGQSKSIIGVNMLRIADHRPAYLQETLRGVVRLAGEGVLRPVTGGVYPAEQIGEAHAALGGRQTTGKLVMRW